MSASPGTHSRTPRPSRKAGAGRVVASDTNYFTDGVELYRWLGEVEGEPIPLVGVENCRTLDVVLMPLAEFEARDLRLVVPSAGA